MLREDITLETELGAAAALYPGFNSAISLKALTYFKDVPRVPPEVRAALIAAVVRVGAIPEVPRKDASLLPKHEPKGQLGS